MEQINLDSSDEIANADQSIIIIQDCEADLDKSKASQALSKSDIVVIDDIEEGEVDVETQAVEDLLFQINFQNNEVFKRLSNKVVSAISEAFQDDSEAIKSHISADQHSILVYAHSKRRPVSKEQSPDYTGLKELFTIDASPSIKTDFVQVPSYKRNIKNVLDEESEASKQQKANACKRTRPSVACFNCGANDHALRECPKPRNLKRISNARRAFTRGADKRYHTNLEQQYTQLRPGVISEQLKKALGVRSGELPFFFYRMRVLGYPPGWLEEAKVAHSGLSLITSDGTKDTLPDDEKVNEGHDKYDVSKIIDFPGFNTKPAGKFYDDYKYHNVPPLNPQHTKEEFIKGLGDNVIKGYKRKKMIITDDKNKDASNNVCLEPADMELEDTDEVQVTVQLPTPTLAEQPLPAEVSSEKLDKTRSPSPSLADLVAQQEELLKALQSSDPDAALEAIAEIAIPEQCQPPPPPPPKPLPQTPITPTTPLIKDSHMGTPLLKFSPYDKLPADNNFRVGVSDVINFENLPDSTGKYEQMKVVIKKVRNIVTQLNKEDDDDGVNG